MAGFQGFGYTSPEEIIAQTQQGFQQALQSGDARQMRAATMQQAAFGLVGSPELRRARQTDKVLKTAFKNAPKTGDEIEDQLAFYKEAQRAGAEAGLPEIAMQATEKISELRLVQEERSRLKSAEGRAVKAESRAEAEESRRQIGFEVELSSARTELDRKNQMIVWDPETGESLMHFDQRDIDGITEAAKLKKENPKLKFATADEVFQVDADLLLQRERMKREAEIAALRAKKEGTVDVIGVREYNRDGTNQLIMQQYNGQAAKLLRDNPAIFTSGSSVDAWAKNLAIQGQSLVDFGFKGGRDAFEARIVEKLDENQIDNAQKRALVMNMAYALATSREGGRLTDQDIDRAIVSLGFLDNPDPRAVITVLLDNATQGRDAWEARSKIGDMKDHSPSTYYVVKSEYEDTITTLNELLESFGGRYDFGDDGKPKTPTPAAGSPNPSGVIRTRKID